jgi:hypothetical protein
MGISYWGISHRLEHCVGCGSNGTEGAGKGTAEVVPSDAPMLTKGVSRREKAPRTRICVLGWLVRKVGFMGSRLMGSLCSRDEYGLKRFGHGR